MKFVFTPDWFIGKDIMIEGFSFIILLVFFILCWRYYKLSKKKNLLYLGLGFLLIAVAQLATILTKLVLYSDTTFIRNIGDLVITYHVVKSIDIFYYLGFFFYRLLTLIGFFVIYRLSLKKKFTEDFFLFLYFIILSVISSASFYYLFHITVLILLGLIISNYYKLYKNNKNLNTGVLLVAFGMLALANLIFIMSKVSVLFVAANFIELVSYIILLVLITRIIRSGNIKKK